MTALGTLLGRCNPLRRRRRASGGVKAVQTFPESPLGIRVALALGADPAADPTTDFSWTDITAYVMLADRGVEIHRGRTDEQTQIQPSWCTMRLNNADGRFSRLNPTGDYYGQLAKNTPIRVQVNPGTGWVTRFVGFVSEWPPRWTHGQKFQWVPVRADGVLRRLGQGSVVKPVANHRFVLDQAGAVGFWPCDTPESALEGGEDLSQEVASVPAPGWSTAPLADGYPDGYDTGAFFGFQGFSFELTTLTHLAADIVIRGRPATDTAFVNVTVNPAGATTLLTGEWNTGSPTVIMRDSLLDTLDTGDTATAAALWDDAPHFWSFDLVENGADVDMKIYLDGVEVMSGTETSQILSDIGPVNFLALAQNAAAVFGQVAIYADTIPTVSDRYLAFTAYAGETDVDRFNRICTEDGIPHVTATGDGIQLGPQPLLEAVAILRDGEAAGQGLLYEALDGRLAYQPVSARYNLPVALALDINQGHIVAPFEPADDDRLTRNDITVIRTGGGRYPTVDEDSIAAVGRYAEELTLGLYTDDQVDDAAIWRLRVGTSTDDDYRYPTVELRLRKSSSLVTDWLACDLGSRVTVDNMPASITPDLVDQIIEGYTERISSVAYDVSANLAPYEPYRVQQLAATPPADDVLDGWLEPTSMVIDGSSFVAGTHTSMDVDVTPAISTSAEDMPMRIRTSGVLLEVTAVGAASGTVQTLTITQTPLNGVVKTVPVGTVVELADPLILTL